MKCPNCNETLLIAERNHIEIDYCPSCRGVWLDKGELDKMLDYAAQNTSFGRQEHQNFDMPNGNHLHEKNQQQHHNKPYKKKSFLNDLFDFD